MVVWSIPYASSLDLCFFSQYWNQNWEGTFSIILSSLICDQIRWGIWEKACSYRWAFVVVFGFEFVCGIWKERRQAGINIIQWRCNINKGLFFIAIKNILSSFLETLDEASGKQCYLFPLARLPQQGVFPMLDLGQTVIDPACLDLSQPISTTRLPQTIRMIWLGGT